MGVDGAGDVENNSMAVSGIQHHSRDVTTTTRSLVGQTQRTMQSWHKAPPWFFTNSGARSNQVPHWGSASAEKLYLSQSALWKERVSEDQNRAGERKSSLNSEGALEVFGHWLSRNVPFCLVL